MTEEQYQAALKIIKEFLVTRGWDSVRMKKDVEDGHWILHWIHENQQPKCPNCYQPYVEQLLQRLEQGRYYDGNTLVNTTDHLWQPHDTSVVRTAAGLADSQ